MSGRHRFALWSRVVLTALFLIVIVVQFLTIGYGLFKSSDGIDLHEGIGYTIAHLLPLLILIATIVLWRGGKQLVMALVLSVLGLIQPVLASVGDWAGVFHPLTAAVMFGLGQWLLAHDRQLLRAEPLPAAGETQPAR